MEANNDFRDLLHLILEKEGFEVVATRTIAEAVHLAKNGSFDLFLVSGEFPDGNGVDFVRQARTFNGGIPIVLISGWANYEDAKAGLEAGASAYLIKPVENEEIILTVKSQIAH
jgi:DNA-binding response OmpR family regulator